MIPFELNLIYNICSSLSNKERLQLGLANPKFYQLLKALFLSLNEHMKCQKKLQDCEKSWKELEAEWAILDYNDAELELRGGNAAQRHDKELTELTQDFKIATFWKNHNESQITYKYHNPFLIWDYQKAKNFACEDIRIKELCKTNTIETAIRLAAAAKTNKISMVDFKLLCSHTNSFDEPSSNGNTALHWALKAGNEFFACVLFEKGAKCTVRNAQNETPLHFAALYNTDNMVGKVLKGGANILARDKNGESALDWAVRKKKTDCIKFLTTHLSDAGGKSAQNS